MSGPLRPAPGNWRRAATLVLAAGWTPPPPPPADGFRLLLMQRASNQGFMPGAHVFPGGVLDAADSSTDWLQLFSPHHRPPRFGLGPAPPPRAAFPVLGVARNDAAALPDDVAFRICAIREAFEEAGVLLLRPRGPPPVARELGRALQPPPGLAAWRARVRRDPRYFLRLCADLDCTPDIWALHDWSNWLTPFLRRPGRRFDTSFYLCCLREPPQSFPDLAEVVGCQVRHPPPAPGGRLSTGRMRIKVQSPWELPTGGAQQRLISSSEPAQPINPGGLAQLSALQACTLLKCFSWFPCSQNLESVSAHRTTADMPGAACSTPLRRQPLFPVHHIHCFISP